MIPLTNHDSQWARSELVIIYPEKSLQNFPLVPWCPWAGPSDLLERDSANGSLGHGSLWRLSHSGATNFVGLNGPNVPIWVTESWRANHIWLVVDMG